jgi:glycosyltransferase involved in cell wall biosynthesis
VALKVAALIPAFQAQATVSDVVRAIRDAAERSDANLPIWVVDDGSSDETASAAAQAGAHTLRHPSNRGKGAALLTGFFALAEQGFDAAVTVDADGQHPADETLKLATHPASPDTLVLGIRDLVRDGAPRNSQFSNSVSNRFLSWFSGQSLTDTQCGLRRYPLREVLRLRLKSAGYAFEAEVILRAARAKIPIEQVSVRVWYPAAPDRISHFHNVKDPARIVFRVLGTWLERGVP